MMRKLAWLTAAALSIAPRVTGAEVTFPLRVDYPILQATLARQLHDATDASGALWGTAGGCRSLVVRDLRVAPSGERVTLSMRGSARLGFGFLGLCLAPLSWDGYLDTDARPEIGPDWLLRFRDLDSQLHDREHRRAAVASRLWDAVKGRLEDRLGAFTYDLGPPVDEAKALLRLSVPPDRAAPILAALDTLRPRAVGVEAEAIRVDVAIDLPPAPPAPAVPEPALAPPDLQRWQATLESWDGFLVFVVKQLGLGDDDPELRDDLLALLLDGRQELLAALAAGPETSVDPVRRLFLDSWDRLRQAVRRAALHGPVENRALRYATFLAAGDALAAIDRAGPALGIEISADGLRRLARLLEPTYAGDPLAHSEAPDPGLRELFHFHDPDEPPPTTAPSPETWWWLGPRAAHAEDASADDVHALSQRLDRWVPGDDELSAYRDVVARLLRAVATREARTSAVESRFAGLYPHLVQAVAWQESCWRQFVRKGDQITYLLSTTGDIGIMQVNRRVWRGFFDLEKLRWDTGYNAGAGAQILVQLLTRYGAREATHLLENAARATYAAYNGGPAAYRRYRAPKVPRAQRAVDRAFWSKYQAMAAGNALDFVLCLGAWGNPSRPQLSVAPPGSTPSCCTRARRSCATPTSPSRHAAIASRPRARRV
jgi:hypothetical protein